MSTTQDRNAISLSTFEVFIAPGNQSNAWRTDFGTKPHINGVQNRFLGNTTDTDIPGSYRPVAVDPDLADYPDLSQGADTSFNTSYPQEVVDIITGDMRAYDRFLSDLADTMPHVNTIRIDVNAATFTNALTAHSWKYFVEKAAAAGYEMLLVYADGDMAGLKYADESAVGGNLITVEPAQEDGTPWAKIAEIAEGWSTIMQWAQGNPVVAPSIYGVELLNEPAAYNPNDPEALRWYAQDMVYLADSLRAAQLLDPQTKILVGGAGYSGKFNELIDAGADAIIREGIGQESLVWSYHFYPSRAFSDMKEMEAYFEGKLSPILGTGDDLLITETNFPAYTHVKNAAKKDSYDYGAPDQGGDLAGYNHTAISDPLADGHSFYLYARFLSTFAEKGVGVTWWTPYEYSSALMSYNGGQLDISPAGYAFATNAWLEGDSGQSQGLHGNERIRAEGPAWTAAGFDGNDTVEASSAAGSYLYGGNGNDRLFGNIHHDFLFGGEGKDVLRGGAGDDALFGGNGNDRLFGDDGHDLLEGGAGDDRLYGGDGNDVLDGGSGNNVSYGGGGADVFVVNPEEALTIGDFSIQEGDKIDLRILGIRSLDECAMTKDADATILITAGSATVRVSMADGASYAAASFGAMDQAQASSPLIDAAHFLFKPSFAGQHLVAREGGDTLSGGQGDDLLTGGSGADKLFGGDGRDTLFGGAGNDTLRGGAGNDVLFTSAGNDKLFGDDGADTFVITRAPGTNQIRDFQSGIDHIDLTQLDVQGMEDLAITYSPDGYAHVVANGQGFVVYSTHPILDAADFLF